MKKTLLLTFCLIYICCYSACLAAEEYKMSVSASGKNYAGADLEGHDFSGQDLRGADFSKADMDEVNFSGADLTGANFEGADIENSNFINANLTNANFSKQKGMALEINGAQYNANVYSVTVTKEQFNNIYKKKLLNSFFF